VHESGNPKAESGSRWTSIEFSPTSDLRPPTSSPRSGISLTEVLISMGLLALGLLGVAAMFPVGSYFLLKGDISDRGAAAAQAAFADLVSRGMLQPEAWVMGNVSWTESLPQRYAYEVANLNSSLPPQDQQQILHSNIGSVFVIDPLGVMNIPTNPNRASQVPTLNTYRFNAPAWYPWKLTSGTERYPIRRVSLLPMVPSISSDPTVAAQETARGRLVAEQLFYSPDDLSIELPEQNDQPGQTRWEQNGTARSYDGLYSWMATIAPTSSAATHALWSGNPNAAMYDVSVAVFHRRPVGEIAAERHVRASVISTGTSGGQLVLTRYPGQPSQLDTSPLSPYDHLKIGQYVTLYGPHPESSNEQPSFFFQWYRVVSVEEMRQRDAQGNETVNPNQRVVTLRGPDWPWTLPQSGNSNVADTSKLYNDLRVGIYNGAVAVHTKTMRLSGRANSGSPWAAAGTTPPTTDPPYVPY
jgi:hypothetical protein